MNTGPAVLLNIHTLERATSPADEIVSAVRTGSPEAFAKLYAIYSKRLYKTIIGITKSPEDAEDALQDTFLRAHLGFRTFEGRSQVYSWLTRIAINSALMVLRKRRACPEILFDPQLDADTDGICITVRDTAPNPEEFSDRRQLQLKVLFAIRKLSPPLQQPIRMQITQGLSIKEIALALDLSNAAVKARLHRARVRLSTVLNLSQSTVRCHDPISIKECDSVQRVRDRSSRCHKSDLRQERRGANVTQP